MTKAEEQRLQKKQEKLKAERQRLWEMQVYERQYQDLAYVCGIDEVGRGPLAGPH